MICHLDFETRSDVDLKNCGAYVYAESDLTDALCLAYCVDDSPVYLWKMGQPIPSQLKGLIKNPDVTFAAHNANFEWLIWNYVMHRKYNWPKIPIERFDCTMVRAFAMGLPGTLENASKAVGLHAQKDMQGHRIMMQLCKPRDYDKFGKPIWWTKKEFPEKYEKLYSYCINDVIVERELGFRLLSLSPQEKKLWFLDQKINARGIKIDVKTAKRAVRIAEKEKQRLDKKMRELTDNFVSTCNASVRLKEWVNKQGYSFKDGATEFDNEMIYNSDVLRVDGVAKHVVNDLLDHEDLAPQVREVLELRKEAAKSSVAKLKKMLSGINSDERIRGVLQYYGAPSTGRWAGRRIQTQNMPRPDLSQKEIDEIFNLFDTIKSDQELCRHIEVFYGSVMSAIADCLRGMLCAEKGKKFIACDFSAIEGRVLAWLAGQTSVLNIYRSHGKIYEYTASQIYNIPIDSVTKKQRLIGKVATLALGYQGGVKAFHSMAKNYLVRVPDSEAEIIKQKWRAANDATVRYWYDLERAAINATEDHGAQYSAGPKGRKIVFLRKGSNLFCKLPSGRAICYPYPKMKMVKTPWGESKNALTYKGEVNRKFIRRVAYGGLLAENITQALARDLLAESLFRLEDRGFPVIMHVHDEALVELKTGHSDPGEIEKIMSELPVWAKGLPISAEAWTGQRFRK